jgi:hypothetical protein
LSASVACPEHTDIGRGGSAGVFDLEEVDGLDDGNGEGDEEEKDKAGDWGGQYGLRTVV